MGELRDRVVYLTLFCKLDEVFTESRWIGHCEFSDSSPFENGHDYADACPAVSWWRERGARRIYIRLNSSGFMWAGDGPPLESSKAMPLFDPADPRGRLEGAATTMEAERSTHARQSDVERVALAIEEGRRRRRQRETLSLSVEELASRVEIMPKWLPDVESGTITSDVTLSEWINLAWATRLGWPDEGRNVKPGHVGWTAQHGSFLREAEEIVHTTLGIHD